MAFATVLRRYGQNTLLAALSLVIVSLFAEGAAFAVEPVNATSDGVAIKGFDPVAYFTEGRPVMGSKEFEYAWMGAKWRFSRADYRDIFAKDPGQYAPQYGGY